MKVPMLGGIMGKTISSGGQVEFFIYKGDISVAADFPILAAVEIGWTYRILADVTDDDPTKTNTLQSFEKDDEIFWNGVNWTAIGSSVFWREDANDVYPTNSKHVNLKGKGLKDDNVTTAVKVGDASNTTAKTINKTILGAINENVASVGTGLVYGGILSKNVDTSKIDITDLGVRVVDSHTNPKTPVLVLVELTGLTGISVTNIASQFVTFFGINAAGAVVQNGVGFSPSDERDVATLGLASHVNLAAVDTVNNFGNWLRDTKLDMADLMSGLGARINLGGNNYVANGSNLRLDKELGFTFGMGVNYANDKKNPNIKTDILQTDIDFGAIKRPSIPVFLEDVPNEQYDPNGDGTLVDIPDGYFTTHRMFYDTSSEKSFLQYGQFVYDSLKKATDSCEKEKFEVDPIAANVLLRTIIIIQKGCTALNSLECTKFDQLGSFGARTLNTIDNFSRFAESVEVIDGMSYQRPALTFLGGAIEVAAEFKFVATDISFVNSDSSINTVAEDFTSGNLQLGDLITVSGSTNNNGMFNIVTLAATKITVVETITDESAGASLTIDTPGKGDITFVFGQREFVLDCTTGSGTYGKARVLVTLGTDVAPQKNWVSAIRSGEIAILQASTSEPTGEYAMLCRAFIPSGFTSTDGGGYYGSRRHTDAKEIEGRGAISTILSKLRDPSSYKSGAAVNITIDTGPSPDSVDFTVAPGVFREIYNQNTLAMQLSVDGAIVLNDEVTPYLAISDLNEIDTDTTGATLNNRYYQLAIILGLNADGYPDRFLINKPNGSYLSASAAFEDTAGYSVTTVPDGFTSAYLLCAGVFRLSGGGTVITNEALGFGVNNIDLRGQALGVKSSGSGTAAVTHFSDDDLRIFSNADDTKEIAFDASGITAATLRTITMPDYDVTLVTADQSNTWTAVQVFDVGLRAAAIGPEVGETVIPFEDAGSDISIELRDNLTITQVTLLSDDLSIFNLGIRTNIIGPKSGDSTVTFKDSLNDVSIELSDINSDVQVALLTDGLSVFNLGIITHLIAPDPGQTVVLFAAAGEDVEIAIANASDDDKIRLSSNGDSELNGGDVLFMDLRQTTINESLADDASIDLTTNTTGWGFVMAGDNEEYAHFRFTAAGVVSLDYNSANVVTTDTDAKLCIFDNGNNVRIRNRLGSAKNIKAVVHLG